ncbi:MULTISPECIES: hypothetical protein [Vibrio]|uniref:hypothetical protein n=1 Tax=Vibrio TaxID=662 RepID=UPI00370B5F17
MRNAIKIKGLEKVLEQAQIRVSTLTITASKVYDNLNDVQTELDQILYKKDQVGFKLHITFYTNVAASYQGIPQSTLAEQKCMETAGRIARKRYPRRCKNSKDRSIKIPDCRSIDMLPKYFI